MASKPGLLTDWPWKSLGTYKYIIVAPWVVHGIYTFILSNEKNEGKLGYFLMFPFLLARLAHNYIWISLSRYRNAKGNNRIIDKGIEFDQIDHESNWDDQIVLTSFITYVVRTILFETTLKIPMWRANGVILTVLLHMGPVEFLYYWLHRALHHHYLYSRYHSHHHSSIVTQPVSAVIHPFGEIVAYFMLFAIPILTTLFTNTISWSSYFGYLAFIDLMNNVGHCNFEFFPKWAFSIFPHLKYLVYTPSYHSLHHTQFRTNYSLFMPIYDYIYNTMDKSTDSLYEKSIERPAESPNVVHLTHLTMSDSMVMRPIMRLWHLLLRWLHRGAYIVTERNCLNKIVSQTWMIPKYTTEYSPQKRYEVNEAIEKAILEAEQKGVKVISLGLLNQGWELNQNGEMYTQKYPKLKMKVVDGNSLALAIVLNNIPKGTTQVLLVGHNLNKFACTLALALGQAGIQVGVEHEVHYRKLKQLIDKSATHDNIDHENIILTTDSDQKIWLIGDAITNEEQMNAPKGTLFIPFSHFPPQRLRKDCYYKHTPAMIAPKSLENMNTCENGLPRRAMSAWRVAGIVHALEEFGVHECGDTMFSFSKIWQASLQHGFTSLSDTITTAY